MGLWNRFLEGRKTRRVARLLRTDMLRAAGALDALPPPLQAEALLLAARALADDEDRGEDALALVRRARCLAPDRADALRLLAWLEPPEQAVETLQALRERSPDDADLALEQAEVLLELDRPRDAAAALRLFREALGVRALLVLGKALYASEQMEEALEVLEAAVAQADVIARSDPLGGDVTVGDPMFQELALLHQAALREVHGDEAVTVDAARRRKLDTRAGVNFKLLAQSLMKDREAAPQVLQLESAEAQRTRGKRLLHERPDSADGHLLLGQADLREGWFARARAHFERAQEVEPRHFGGVLGHGAALQLEEQRAADVASRLPLSPELDAWVRVVPDLPALTPLERRVVWASVAPLAPLKPVLEAAGARIRVLPLDVRPTDLPELADVRDERADDHRAYACVAGLAYDKLAVVKVEELLELESGAGWTFAHELAHLVLTHAPEHLAARVRRFHGRFSRSEHLGTDYQLSNEQEFFACGYVDFLRERHGTARHTEHDDAGELARLFDFFEGLGEAEASRARAPARRSLRTMRRR